MKNFTIAQVAQILGSDKPGDKGGNYINGVSTDSRTIRPGQCFVAIAGDKFDGHDYTSDAFAKGAVCAVVSRNIDKKLYPDKPVIIVNETIEALAKLAAQYRRQCGFKVIAITGSVGKTTTRRIIHHVLSRHYRTHQSPRSFNNNIGLPLTLLNADPNDHIIVAELGTNHPGEIANLTNIAQPDIALITNVYPAHLEGFSDLEGIAQEKLSIANGLTDSGVLIINGENTELGWYCRYDNARTRTFGTSAGCDYFAQNIVLDGLVGRFTIDERQIYLPLPGKGNIENVLAAWAVCCEMGLNIDDFAKAIETLPAVSMRLEILHIGSILLLNDCYNANPVSMENALDVLGNIAGQSEKMSRRIFICGDMNELGSQSENFHEELGRSVAVAGVDLLLAVGKFAPITTEAAERQSPGKIQTLCFKDTETLCKSLDKFVKEDDIILVKGSRSVSLEAAVETLRQLFAPGDVPIPITQTALKKRKPGQVIIDEGTARGKNYI
jgi:UDP-N-acetylmuramoyl-tripeptide--D-alanyl-D-alanine ligase